MILLQKKINKFIERQVNKEIYQSILNEYMRVGIVYNVGMIINKDSNKLKSQKKKKKENFHKK